MKNNQTPTIRQIRPASTTDVLSPVQLYAPASRAETPSISESRIPNHTPIVEPQNIHSPEASTQSPPTSSSRASKPKTRNGKIARLPHAVRDTVNRMLRNNIPHSKIVDALDEHDITVTQRNVSNWKTRGGYRDWCDQQDRALETRLLQDNLVEHLRTTDATQLSEVGLQLAATQLSQFFLKPDVREQLTADPEKFSPAIGILCKLSRQLHRLQKYRDDMACELGLKYNPERLKREKEKDLEITRNIYSAAKLGATIHEHDIPHRNFMPKNPSTYLVEDDSDEDSLPSAFDPRQVLSDLNAALKNRDSLKSAKAKPPTSSP